jgi:soluble lytic murein transglycosylase-like protein
MLRWAMKRLGLSLVLFLVLAPCAMADTYVYVDDNGVLTFTDSPTSADAVKVVVNEEPQEAFTRPSSRPDYRNLIEEACARYGMDPDVISALIQAESAFDARAVSRKGALGLMQLMPETAEQMGVYNLLDPAANIDAGVRYLKALLRKFDGDLTLALAAYNAGPGVVLKYGAVPPIEETQRYIEKIFSIYRGSRLLKVSEPEEVSREVYRVVLEDGTVLYTDSTYYLTYSQ